MGVTLARRLDVRLEFTDRVLGETGQGDEGRRVPRSLRRDAGLRLARLVTREKGLHAVAWEELPGLAGPPALSWLRLSRQGSSVAFHVEPRTGSFGPGSVLYFVGEGTKDAYGNEAVYGWRWPRAVCR